MSVVLVILVDVATFEVISKIAIADMVDLPTFTDGEVVLATNSTELLVPSETPRRHRVLSDPQWDS